jgi:hypothetical protein
MTPPARHEMRYSARLRDLIRVMDYNGSTVLHDRRRHDTNVAREVGQGR